MSLTGKVAPGVRSPQVQGERQRSHAKPQSRKDRREGCNSRKEHKERKEE